MAAVITEGDVLPLVLAAVPSLAARWDEFDDRARVDEDDADEEYPVGSRLTYADAGSAAFFAADLLADGGRDEVAALLAVVERLLAEGDAKVRNLAQIGYLEDLQNAVLQHPALGYGDVEPLLGPLGLLAWLEVHAFWHGVQPG